MKCQHCAEELHDRVSWNLLPPMLRLNENPDSRKDKSDDQDEIREISEKHVRVVVLTVIRSENGGLKSSDG